MRGRGGNWVCGGLRVGALLMVALSLPVAGGAAAVRQARVREAAAVGTWHRLPTTDVSSQDALTAVSCTSQDACIAVGTNGNLTLAEQWNGRSWKVLPTPNPSTWAVLNAVSCTSAAACTAVGQDAAAGTTLVERWDGAAWTIEPTAALGPGIIRAGLGGVSCTTATACIAVGSMMTSAGQVDLLAEQWNGAPWQIIPVASPRNPGDAILDGISCTSPGACVAVGNVSGLAPLVERWNGVSWEIPQLPPTIGFLASVSCSAPRFCMTVGGIDTGVQVLTLGFHWNGLNWALQSIPGATEKDTFLNSVSCASTTGCTAVGRLFRTTLAERWISGVGWSIEPTPSPANVLIAELDGVSCTSPTRCIAVGSYDGSGRIQILAMAKG